MSQKDNYHKLACNFLDAWQEHMTTMLSNGDYVKMLLQMMQNLPSSATENNTYAPYFTTKTEGAAPSPDARDAALARIERSMSIIERRLEKLEDSALASRSPRARKADKSMAKPARRSPARAGSGGGGKKKSKRVS